MSGWAAVEEAYVAAGAAYLQLSADTEGAGAPLSEGDAKRAAAELVGQAEALRRDHPRPAHRPSSAAAAAAALRSTALSGAADGERRPTRSGD